MESWKHDAPMLDIATLEHSIAKGNLGTFDLSVVKAANIYHQRLRLLLLPSFQS